MNDAARIDSLERNLRALRAEFAAYREGRNAIFDDVQELFAEIAKALDVTALALDALSPFDEANAGIESTGVTGRSAELIALVGIFRNNLKDLGDRLTALAASSGTP